MVDVNVDFIFENEEPINADFQLEPDVTYTADIKLSEATRDHTKLYNRDEADQHPMSAITGLESALGDLETAISDEETRAKGVEQDLASSIDSNHQAISDHVSNKNNPHEVTKAQVGLGNVDNTSDSDKPVSTATQTALDGKVDKTTTADRVYGTDSSGNQTTYDKGSFGQVDDVQVGGVSVVTNKVAELGTMAGESASDYTTTSDINTALALKQDNLTAGTGIDISSDTVSVADPTIINNGTGTKALAMGKTSQSTAEGGVAVGYGARANSTYGTAVGYDSRANNTNTTAIGKGAKASNARSIAIGSGAEANADDAIAIKGVNNTANTLQVYTYNILDMSTGLIPDARISANIARTSDLPTNYVTTDTAQTITGTKTFHNCAIESDNFITLTSSNAYIRYSGSGVVRSLLRRNSSGTVEVGSSNDTVKIQGSATRPAYNSSDLALYSDVTSGDSALQSQIDDLKSRGHFLALWNCATGLAETNPPQSPYTYQAGDFFIVGVVSTANPPVNYMPDGSSYTTGVASTTVESGAVDVDDTYYYDGTTWKLQINTEKTTAFVNIAGDPYDNTNLATALNAKADSSSLASVATSGDYDDLIDKPTIPTDTSDLTNGAGFITGITSTDVTNALGYTPYDNTNPDGFISGITSGDVTTALGYTPYNATNPSGYITGITSGDVTTALGYTPYDNSNPSGYITGITSGDVTTALGYTPVNPTSLASVATSGLYSDLSGTPTVDQTYDGTSTNAQSGQAIEGELANYVQSTSLATVATTGDYDDLINTPTVDLTYDGTSSNAQSGLAVASAISTKQDSATALTTTNTYYSGNTLYIG